MVATAAVSSFFPVRSSAQPSSTNAGGGPDSLDVRGIISKPSISRGMLLKANANARANPKVVVKMDRDKAVKDAHSSVATTFYNQRKPGQRGMPDDAYLHLDGLVFQQNFPIRSYDIGPDNTATIETLVNHLQESLLNHLKSVGLLHDGLGATPEMIRRNLIWVVTRTQVLVEYYPSWGDIVEVANWIGVSGKNSLSLSWHIRDFQTDQTILRAASVWMIMNTQTRRLSKIPDDVRTEMEPHFVEHAVFEGEDNRKLSMLNADTADYVKNSLTPRWGDLDVNEHVNNVKYFSLILESAPMWILESHQIARMTLEYRKECGRDDMLESLTKLCTGNTNSLPETEIECEHMLRLECGEEIARARTLWKQKRPRDLLSTQAI